MVEVSRWRAGKVRIGVRVMIRVRLSGMFVRCM